MAVVLAAIATSGATAKFILPQLVHAQRWELLELLEQRKCERAVRLLDRYVSRSEPWAVLLAGHLSEYGHCIERDADKAWAFFERAHVLGEESAPLRMAALAASSEGGADVAATLWWAGMHKERGPHLVSGNCSWRSAAGDNTQEGFLQVLKSWSQERLAACRAWLGFMSRALADLYYPLEALRSDTEGEVKLVVDLASGDLEVSARESNGGELLAARVKQVATHAMTRIVRPERSQRIQVEFVFRIGQ